MAKNQVEVVIKTTDDAKAAFSALPRDKIKNDPEALKAYKAIENYFKRLDKFSSAEKNNPENLPAGTRGIIRQILQGIADEMGKLAPKFGNKKYDDINKSIIRNEGRIQDLKKSEKGLGFLNSKGEYRYAKQAMADELRRQGLHYKNGNKIAANYDVFKKNFSGNLEDGFRLTDTGKGKFNSTDWEKAVQTMTHMSNFSKYNEMSLRDKENKIEMYGKANVYLRDALIKTDKGTNTGPIGGFAVGKVADIDRATAGEAKKKQEAENNNLVIADEVDEIPKLDSTLGKAFKQFTLYALAMKGLKLAIKEGVQTITELDKSLTEQAMVTGLAREQTYKLMGSYQELAGQLGATTKEVAEVATEYMKQGKTIEESLILTKAAVSAAKVARVSVGDSINYLTTALNGFRLEAEDAMKVSDKFAAVAAASASDYDEIAIAMSKVASQANLAGMSIDYTMALLTKGLETTREAPETMGTALKTIIARMREMSDYGKTLDGDTDINNVESQLAYVDIKLRDTNGELRSTESVLDELGKKWDLLSKNQQAALAKALAGTRQQSRLIALMDNYERVTELQQISQRSLGATSAQASTYLEGIEASLNSIRVAWEKITTSITNNEMIIWILKQAGSILDAFAETIQNTVVQVGIMGGIVTMGIKIISNKILENKLAKEHLKLQKESLKVQNEMNKNRVIGSLDTLRENHKDKLDAVNGDWHKLEDKELKSKFAAGEKMLGMLDEQSTMIEGGGMISQLFKGGKMGAIIGGISKALPWIAAAVGGLTVLWTTVKFIQDKMDVVKNTSDHINKLGTEIYKLNEKNNSLTQVLDKFDAIDNKIIKTKDDLKQMNSLLASAADKMTDEEKKNYNSLGSNSAKREYIEKVQKEGRTEAIKLAQEQFDSYNKMSAKDKEKFKNSTEDRDIVARDNLRTGVNASFYNKIDDLKSKGLDSTEANNIEQIVGQLLDQASFDDVLKYQDSETLNKLISSISGKDATILNSETSSLKERAEAAERISKALDETNQIAFKNIYKDIFDFGSLDDGILDFIDKMKLGNEELQKMSDKWLTLKKLGLDVTQSEFNDLITKQFLPALAEGQSMGEAVETAFGEWLNKFDKNSKEYKDLYNSLVGLYGDVVTKGPLNMGQSMQSLKSSVNSIYEIAQKWGSLKDSERASFINDNGDLFSGEDGAELLKAFESQDYNRIYEKLGQNEGLSKRVQGIKDQIQTELDYQLSLSEDQQNKGYIQELINYQNFLNDKDKLLKASLDTRLKQEQAQIEEYKKFLDKQKEAITKSLEDRKSAYDKYYQDVDKNQSDEDYNEKHDLLASNLAKLGSTNSVDAKKQSAELERQLQDLEKERFNELRQRAREAVIDNIDTELSDINKKFDDLLNNNNELLELMKTNIANPKEFIGNILSQGIKSGMTHTEMESYVGDLQNRYGSIMPGFDWNQVQVGQNGNNLTLNIGGETIELTPGKEQDLRASILKALQEIGYK